MPSFSRTPALTPTLFVLSLLLLLTACNGMGSGPEATVYKFNQHVSDGKIDSAINLLSSGCRKGGDEKWRLMLETRSAEIEKRGGITNLEVEADEESVKTETHTDPDTGTETERKTMRLRTTVEYGDGQKDVNWVTLVDEDGWKIGCTGK